MKRKKPNVNSVTVDISKADDPMLKAADQAMIRRFCDKHEARITAPKLKYEGAQRTPSLSYDGEDDTLTAIALMESLGTTSFEFSNFSMTSLLNATCRGGDNNPITTCEVNGVIGALHGIKPSDEIEAMLVSQMLATHFAAMAMVQRLNQARMLNQMDSYGNLTAKLLRCYTAQMDSLTRYRGKGQQKVTVEHVHVHSGGQAIVGNVTHGGGGVTEKTEDQPHAKQITRPNEIALSPQPTMRSEDTERKPLPVSRDA